ncbi:hypothetical protein MACH26_04950 [Planctobacterium marinum]|uniref:tRNA-uridine aminocarboxypropyltransferase n=2 Tax=Planctobacterium marinum TaxID=1631968 RepID=A0AA48HGM7_9ALTE|nr:hypothetical protein MACH26_04950 [Planctobacterium marinum]
MHYSGELHILQHPLEQNHSKNTARLVKQLLPQTIIWPGESESDFAYLKAKIAQEPQAWGCIYPAHDSAIQTGTNPPLPTTRLLFIDATWRKARKIWHLNPWLHSMPCYRLSNISDAQYRIRKNHADHQLSTLEAVACSLSSCTDVTPLLDLLHRFQLHFENIQPRHN